MLNMHNHGNPQKLVLNGVQSNEKLSYRHFIKHLECTNYTNIWNNAWTYVKLAYIHVEIPLGANINTNKLKGRQSNQQKWKDLAEI